MSRIMVRIGAASWFSSKRLRAHALILALCLWSVYLWNISAPGLKDRNGIFKGADFLQFYTLGSVARAHRTAELYDTQVQSQISAQRMPEAAGIRFLLLYPPQVSILFAPFARLPYTSALALWLILASAIYALCCYALWRTSVGLRAHTVTVFMIAAAFPGFWHLILWGQTSALALGFFTLAFLALRARKEFLAGLAVGCLVYKPQLALAAAFVFIFTLRWRVIAGAVLAASAQLAVGWAYYGSDSIYHWLKAIIDVPHQLPMLEPKPFQMHSLRSLWILLVPGPILPFALYILTSLIILGLTLSIWNRRPAYPLGVRFSALLLASVLCAPHLFVYDLVILAPMFLLLSNCILTQERCSSAPQIKPLLYLIFVAPLIGPLARWTHLQVSVVLMSLLVYVIWQTRGTGLRTADSAEDNRT
ncbi:MAG TPA: glycosyltransferase family 87 protein [Candidatus Sulfotelmatobacter sp.]